jgi:type II secretory pathway component PulK
MSPVRARSRARKAVVLLAVLVVTVLLSLAAYKYSDYMLSEYRATDAAIRSSQAKMYADSGVDYTAAMLVGDALGGNPWDNTGAFQNIAVGGPDSNGRQDGRFTVLSLRAPEDVNGGQPYVFGAQDEASKINLNSLLALDKGVGDIGQKILMALPNMTEDVAAAILDWMDPDDTPRTGGAENETYSGLGVPYRCKNGPLDSLEELLLVRGVTPQLLFGNDKNRNGILDADEQDGGGVLDMGWSAYLTVYSREANADSTGKARVNLNGKDVTQLYTQLQSALGQELALFVMAYKLYGPANTAATGTVSVGKGGGIALKMTIPKPAPPDVQAVTNKVQEDLAKASQSSGQKTPMKKIGSLWDMATGEVQVAVPDGDKKTKTVSYPSPLADPSRQRELLPLLLDKCTTSDRLDLRPRVNAMSAPATVLNAFKEVAGLTDADVQNIISKRPTPDVSGTDPVYKTAAWLVTDCNIPAKTMKQLDPYLTGTTQVYRIQSLGYSQRGGPTARVEAVIDTNMGRPRIVYWRDLSELGKGFELPRDDR